MINLLVGVLIEFFVVRGLLTHCFPNEFQWAQNLGVDAVTRYQAAGSIENDSALPRMPLVFIDIDERTWRDLRWGGGEPLEAPRDGLLALMDFGLERGPRALVLDVLLDHRTVTTGDLHFSAGLRTRLSAMRLAASAPADLTRVVLVSEALPLNAEDNDGDDAWPTVRAMPLDDLALDPVSPVTEAAPLFTQSAIDRELRDWVLWRVVCRPRAGRQEGVAAVLPSVQVVALADGIGPAPWKRFDGPPCPPARDKVGWARVQTELDAQMRGWLATQPAIRGVKALASPDEPISNRIFFRSGDADTATGRRFDHGRVIRLSALDIMERPQLMRRTLSDNDWRRAVVIVGQSHSAAHDNYLTPLGDMPGALVVANSVDSLAHSGIASESHVIDYLSTALSLTLSAAAVAWWPSVVGFLVSLLVVVALGAVSLFLSGHGVWVDFMLPMLSMIVVEMIEHSRHWLRELREKHESGHSTIG